MNHLARSDGQPQRTGCLEFQDEVYWSGFIEGQRLHQRKILVGQRFLFAKTPGVGSVLCGNLFPQIKLGGGFRYFLFSPLFGEDLQFD